MNLPEGWRIHEICHNGRIILRKDDERGRMLARRSIEPTGKSRLLFHRLTAVSTDGLVLRHRVQADD